MPSQGLLRSVCHPKVRCVQRDFLCPPKVCCVQHDFLCPPKVCCVQHDFLCHPKVCCVQHDFLCHPKIRCVQHDFLCHYNVCCVQPPLFLCAIIMFAAFNTVFFAAVFAMVSNVCRTSETDWRDRKCITGFAKYTQPLVFGLWLFQKQRPSVSTPVTSTVWPFLWNETSSFTELARKLWVGRLLYKDI